MVGIPALCSNPRCRYVFNISNFITGSGSGAIEIEGVATRCPRCKSLAYFGDGSYHYQDNKIKLINGPTLTRELINRLSEIANTAKQKVIKKEELLAEIADVSPEIAQKLRERGLAYFVIIILLIWLVRSVSLDIKIDINQLIDQAQDAASQYEGQDVLDAPLPDHPDESDAPAQPTWVDRQTAPMSRQVRRQLERQSRKAQRRTETKQV